MEYFFENLEFSASIYIIITPLVFMVADIISGFIGAVIRNEVKSKVMREGLLHKILLILIISLSILLDLSFNFNFISKSVSIYIIVMEFISILENLKKAGVNTEKLIDIFKKKGSDSK